ncbi:Uncharacterised protein [Bartonella vinsonii]|uniref:Uncharacterized protein n=1 Tax=Bartonella vinsonii TaxID=33047 RepID=A0A3S4YHI0_BARVI|nr:Uncharacterised protein [Bartonella vinsonii]
MAEMDDVHAFKILVKSDEERFFVDERRACVKKHIL